MVATLALLVGGLAYCSFGPEEYTGPWPPEAPADDAGNDGGPADDGGGPVDDGGGSTDGGG